MSKEALKLALEHAKRDERHLNHAETRYWCRMYRDIAEKAVEALAKPDFWEGYVPEPVKPAQQGHFDHTTAANAALRDAQSRSYQIAKCKYPKCNYPCTDLPDCRDAEQPAKQEPVAFLDWYDNAHWGNEDFKDGCWRAWDAALEHTSPPAQRTWVSLTDEDKQIAFDDTQEGGGFWEFADAIEAKLKEKNT
jgi:hypothetical protein